MCEMLVSVSGKYTQLATCSHGDKRTAAVVDQVTMNVAGETAASH